MAEPARKAASIVCLTATMFVRRRPVLAAAALLGAALLVAQLLGAPLGDLRAHLTYQYRARQAKVDCPQTCWQQASSPPSTGEAVCRQAPAACGACIFCTWGGAASRTCPAPEVLFANPSCATADGGSRRSAAPPTFEPGRLAGCVDSTGAKPHVDQQMRGLALEAVCHSLRSSGSPQPNMLFFSVGFDSPFWMALNGNGTTRFVENIPQWIAMQPEEVRNRTTAVTYTTKVWAAGNMLCDRELLGEMAEKYLAGSLGGSCWDVIFVDGPLSFGFDTRHGEWTPGRMQAVYAAALLGGPQTTVFVDDCERSAESLYTLEHLSAGRVLQVFWNGHAGYTCMVRSAQ